MEKRVLMSYLVLYCAAGLLTACAADERSVPAHTDPAMAAPPPSHPDAAAGPGGADSGTVPITDATPPPQTGDDDASIPVADAGTLPDPIRIMPLGDSLTFGTSSNGGDALAGGYRIRLHTLLQEAGYTIDYVGSARNGPPDFDGDHESMNGASIARVTEMWEAATPVDDPHVVLLMAGTNDALGVTADQPPKPAARALAALIDRILEDQPDVRVVVAKLIPLVAQGPFGLVGEENAQRIPSFNDLVEDLVREKQTTGLAVHLADLSSIAGDALGDGIHPTTMETYDDMAELWLPAVVEAIEALR